MEFTKEKHPTWYRNLVWAPIPNLVRKTTTLWYSEGHKNLLCCNLWRNCWTIIIFSKELIKTKCLYNLGNFWDFSKEFSTKLLTKLYKHWKFYSVCGVSNRDDWRNFHRNHWWIPDGISDLIFHRISYEILGKSLAGQFFRYFLQKNIANLFQFSKDMWG